MKFAAQCLSVLTAAGLVMGTVVPADASGKKKEETDIVKIIDADLKALDKALFGWLTPKK
jgi:hypothetical protein